MNCDGCTLCCLVLPVPSLGKAAGEWCKDCDRGVGCRVWEKRAAICSGFFCAYAQVPKASVNLRPDKCHVIFERLNGMMVGTMEPGHSSAIESGPVIGQIQSFLREGMSVVIGSFQDRKARVFPVSGKTIDGVWREFNEQRQAWL